MTNILNILIHVGCKNMKIQSFQCRCLPGKYLKKTNFLVYTKHSIFFPYVILETLLMSLLVAGGLDQVTSKSPFQPVPFNDDMILIISKK